MQNGTVEHDGITGTISDYVVNGKTIPGLCNVTVDYGSGTPLHTACDRSFGESHLNRLIGVAKTIVDSMDAGEAA